MYKEAVKAIKKAKTIYIATHVNPDGDAVGSSMALYCTLQKMGKNVKVIIPKYSYIFDRFPSIDETVSGIAEEKIDLLIVTDSSDLARVAIPKEDISKAEKIICIDHHKTNALYGDINIIDTNAPAACEVVYGLVKKLKVDIDLAIGTYIYAGIMTDTGSFKYSNTRVSTLEIAAELVKRGVVFSEIARDLLDTIKESKLKLLSKYITNLESIEDGKIRYCLIEYADIEALGVDDEDSEGMTNYGQMIQGTEVSIYVRGKEDGSYKVSMRSNGNVELSSIALSYGGGGHARAAGFPLEASEKDENKRVIIKLIKEQLKKLWYQEF